MQWLPVHRWSTEQVFAAGDEAGGERHPAYALGQSGASCVLCIYLRGDELLRAATANPVLAQFYELTERTIGHRFRLDISMAEILTAVGIPPLPDDTPRDAQLWARADRGRRRPGPPDPAHVRPVGAGHRIPRPGTGLMSLKSSIEWLYDPYLDRAGATWNRWYGCTRESSACSNCYIPRTPPLRMRHLRFDKVAVGGKTPIVMADPKVLYKPLTYRAPLLIFPNSLSDLWHPAVSIERVAEMFAIMLLASRHIFPTTTKRHRRQRNWLRSARFHRLVAAALDRIVADSPVQIPRGDVEAAYAHLATTGPGEPMRPLTNVWIGVTCEANENGERLRYLAGTPAEVTWASCEPVTDPDLDLTWHLQSGSDDNDDERDGVVVALRPPDWFVFGGESGPAAKATDLDTEPAPGLRPLDLDHVGALIGQAHSLGAAVFVQLGQPWAKAVGAASAAGRDPAEWPQHLRVREYPIQLAERALRFDPGNRLALAALADRTAPDAAVRRVDLARAE